MPSLVDAARDTMAYRFSDFAYDNYSSATADRFLGYMGPCWRPANLGSLVDGEDGTERGLFVVRGDVVVDVLQPAPGFGGPDYLRHDSRVRRISNAVTRCG